MHQTSVQSRRALINVEKMSKPAVLHSVLREHGYFSNHFEKTLMLNNVNGITSCVKDSLK